MRQLLSVPIVFWLVFSFAAASPRAAEEIMDDGLVQIIAAKVPEADLVAFKIGIKHLPSGRAAYWNADDRVEAASLFKLPILLEAYRQQAAGLLLLGEPLWISEEDVEEAASLGDVGFADSLTVDEALENMITVSDNLAALALLHRIGCCRSLNRSLAELGLTGTVVDVESTATARDMVRYFELLARLEAVNPDASRAMLGRLLRQRINDRLPSQLPAGVPVAHKTGNMPGVSHDAGLLYTPAGPVALAILTDKATDPGLVPLTMGRLAAAVYAYAGSGGFGAAREPPLLWDPVLDARVRSVLPNRGRAVGLAIKHLRTGQGMLIDADRTWPWADLSPFAGLTEELFAAAFLYDGRRQTWLTGPGRLLNLAETLFQGRIASAEDDRYGSLLSAASPPAGLLAASPAVLKYWPNGDDGTSGAAAIFYGEGGPYAVALLAADLAPDELVQLGATIHAYFAGCSWAAQVGQQACRGGVADW